MPRNRPNIGDTNWGTTLNNHLNQISPNGGGINYGTTAQRPTLTNNDDGYTYFDTTTKQVIRWNGTQWEVIIVGLPSDTINNFGASIITNGFFINGQAVSSLTITGTGVQSFSVSNGNATLTIKDDSTIQQPPSPPTQQIVEVQINPLDGGNGKAVGTYIGPTGVFQSARFTNSPQMQVILITPSIGSTISSNTTFRWDNNSGAYTPSLGNITVAVFLN